MADEGAENIETWMKSHCDWPEKAAYLRDFKHDNDWLNRILGELSELLSRESVSEEVFTFTGFTFTGDETDELTNAEEILINLRHVRKKRLADLQLMYIQLAEENEIRYE